MSSDESMLKSLFNQVLAGELFKRLKSASLENIDLIMYFGDQEIRDEVNSNIIPEVVQKLQFINLIRFEQRLKRFMKDFTLSLDLVTKEINKRKKMVDK